MAAGIPPLDWYRTSFAPNFQSLYWEDDGERKAQLALALLSPRGDEKILDLACATGRRTIELSRHGFYAVGVDIRAEFLEVAACDAVQDDLLPYFVEADPRELTYRAEFEIALSLGGGAFGHFDFDREDLEAFIAVARTLKPGGSLLLQMPNVLHVETHLTERVWLRESDTIELIEQYWDPATQRLRGTRTSLIGEESVEVAEPHEFQRRLYTIEELAAIFEGSGLTLTNVYDEDGIPCAPSDVQRELFIKAES